MDSLTIEIHIKYIDGPYSTENIDILIDFGNGFSFAFGLTSCRSPQVGTRTHTYGLYIFTPIPDGITVK